MTFAQDDMCAGLLPFHGYDRRIAVAVDFGHEDEWPATDGAVLDELLAPAAGGVDGDVVLLETGRARIGGVGFQRH